MEEKKVFKTQVKHQTELVYLKQAAFIWNYTELNQIPEILDIF